MYPSCLACSSWIPTGPRPHLSRGPAVGPRVHLTLVREVMPEYRSFAPDLTAASAPDLAPTPAPAPEGEVVVAGERADALLALGDRIAELARSIQVAEGEMMRLIVEFDRRRGWAEAGFGSCAEWLAWRIGVRLNAARERVRTAKALAELPLASAAVAAGCLSFAKARALTRVATPESEAALLALADAGSADNLERVVRAWKAMDDAQELTAEQVRHRRRRFSVFIDDDGSYLVKGRLDPEAGAMLMRAVEAAGDALYREEGGGGELDAGTTPAQRRADAVGLLAERALAAGFGDTPRGSRADRYQVLLHVEADTLRVDRPSGRSELDGVRVCRETSRRLTCDAGVATVERVRVEAAPPEVASAAVASPGVASPGAASPGAALAGVAPGKTARHVTAVTSAGRRTRTVAPALRRALLARDRGCRFPGCGSRFTEAHHIVHWADGGPTELPNLVLLCRRHHRAVHENGMRICLDRTAAVVFFTSEGRALTGAPAPAPRPAAARTTTSHSDAPRTATSWATAQPTAAKPTAPQPTTAQPTAAQPTAPQPTATQPTATPPTATSPTPTPRRLPPAPPSAAPYPGAARFRRDRSIPWNVEARVWEALDTG